MLGHTPVLARSARGAAVVGGGVVVAGALASQITVGAGTLRALPPQVGVVAHALVLAAAGSVYLHRRQVAASRVASIGDASLGHRLAWLVVVLLVAAVPALVLPDLLGDDAWLLVGHVAVMATLFVVVRASRRRHLVSDPAIVGLTTSLGITAVAILAAAAVPVGAQVASASPVLSGLLVVLGLVLARDLWGHPTLTEWTRRRLAVCVAALATAQAARPLDGLLASQVAIVGYAVAAVAVSVVALRLQGRALEEYEVEVHQMQQQVTEQRELLHELGATLAGIASASELMRDRSTLPAPRRQRLEEMMGSEVARMVRLMDDRARSAVLVDVEVDAVVGPIVLSHQARGRDVRWNESHLSVHARADDVAEIVNVLLENAARHAGRAPVLLTASGPDVHGFVEIACVDLGPGVPGALRHQIFEAGVRRVGSQGDGLGLAIARRLATDLGGTLELRPSSRGATFVVGLPAGTRTSAQTTAHAADTSRESDVVARAS